MRRPGTAAVLLLAVTAGCGTQTPAAAPAGAESAAAPTTPTAPPATAAPTTSAPTTPPAAPGVVVIGDSVTRADSQSFATDSFGPASWVWTAEGGAVDVLGGWAVAGATTTDMLAGAEAAPRAEVLVVMAGTNDVLNGVPWSTSAANIETIVKTVDPERVVLSGIVPLESDPAAAARFNAGLVELAAANGWEIADPGAAVRQPDGGWLPGTTADGIHPTEVGAERIGAALHIALAG
jgi:lysophospholipase L1-like esterase